MKIRNTIYATLLALSLGCGTPNKTDIPVINDVYSQVDAGQDLESLIDASVEDVQNKDVYTQGEDVNLDDIYVNEEVQGTDSIEYVDNTINYDASVEDVSTTDLSLEEVLGNEDSVDYVDTGSDSNIFEDIYTSSEDISTIDYLITEDADPCANNHAPTIEAWIDNPKPDNTYAPLEDIIVCMNVTDPDNNFDHCYISNYQYIDTGNCDCLSTYYYQGDEGLQVLFVGVTDFCDAVAYKSFNVTIK